MICILHSHFLATHIEPLHASLVSFVEESWTGLGVFRLFIPCALLHSNEVVAFVDSAVDCVIDEGVVACLFQFVDLLDI